MSILTTHASLLSSTALSSSQKVTAQFLISAVPLTTPKQITTHHLVSGVPFAGPKKITAHYLISAISLAAGSSQSSEFVLIRLEPNDSIFGIESFAYELSTFPIPEHNPYRPRIPEQLIRLGEDHYDFEEENQQIHREQHNITQAGDTTFPFQLAVQAHDNKLYKLGSIAKFYHEDYGVMLARYVQFSEMVSTQVAHSPVGLFKKSTSLDWIVTNNFSLSNPNLVVGMSIPFALPREGQYGWAMIDGPNLQQLVNNSTTAVIGESLIWDASGSVSNTAAGKILGRRVNKIDAQSLALLQGQMWIHPESLSEASITSLINSVTQDLRDLVTKLNATIGSLPSAGAIIALQNSINSIKLQLSLEISQRKAVDAAIQQQIADLDAVTQEVLDNALTGVASNLAAAVAALQTQLDSIRAIAIEALDKANQALAMDLAGLETQVNLILTLLTQEVNRVKGRFPVVDGSVPPNLVYMDDGSLVFVETR